MLSVLLQFLLLAGETGIVEVVAEAEVRCLKEFSVDAGDLFNGIILVGWGAVAGVAAASFSCDATDELAAGVVADREIEDTDVFEGALQHGIGGVEVHGEAIDV